MNETNGFIKQTARDYDLPYHVVEKIYRTSPDTLYEELEIILKESR